MLSMLSLEGFTVKDAKDAKRWVALAPDFDQTADDAAAHPVEAIEPVAAGSVDGAMELFRRLMMECLPAAASADARLGVNVHMGAGRRWRAGYNRMVATCYVVAPELFNGMEPRQIAEVIGLSHRQFRKHVDHVSLTIAARTGVAPGRRIMGKSPKRDSLAREL